MSPFSKGFFNSYSCIKYTLDESLLVIANKPSERKPTFYGHCTRKWFVNSVVLLYDQNKYEKTVPMLTFQTDWSITSGIDTFENKGEGKTQL